MSTTVDNELVRDLAGRVSGPVLSPRDPGYDEARAVHNGLVDRRPAVIVRARTAGDVVAALALARRNGLEVSVRGGGHNVAGRAVTDGGLMISLADMHDIAVDPERATVTAQGGATWNELNAAAGAHGLAVTGGAVSTTGIAGLTLGGGLGWLMAKHGLAADNLLGVELVTAAGEVLEVDAVLAPGPVLGAARRRRELRRRHLAHLPPAPRRHGHRGPDRPPDRRRSRPAPLLPRRRGRGVGRPDGLRRAGARAGRLRDQARGAGRLPCGRPGRGRARAGAVQGVRIAAHDRGRPDAVPRDEHAAGRRVPRRRAQLLALELHPGPAGRPHRHRRRAVRLHPLPP